MQQWVAHSAAKDEEDDHQHHLEDSKKTKKTPIFPSSFSLFLFLLLLFLETNVAVIGTAEARTVEVPRNIFQSDLLGCLYADGLCNDDEICFDDNLFGRCVSADDPDDKFIRFTDLSDGSRALLTFELDRLSSGGLGWDDAYAQCILKNIEDAVQYDSVFDESDCDVFLPDEEDDNDDDDNDMMDEDEGEMEEEERDFLEALGPEEVVPKKMIRSEQDFVLPYYDMDYDDNVNYNDDNGDDGDNEENFVDLDRRSDTGDIIIQPDTNALLSAYGSEVGDSSDVLIPEDVDDIDEDDVVILPDGEVATVAELEAAAYLAMRDAFANALLEEEEEMLPNAILADEEEDQYLPEEEEDEEFLPVVRKVGKRAGSSSTALAPTEEDYVDDQEGIYENEYPPPMFFPSDYYDDDAIDAYDDAEQDLQQQQQQQPDYPFYDFQDYGNEDGGGEGEGGETGGQNAISRFRGGDLGTNIFNRNERLDVKKPGPFYKASPNNFFLNKLLSSDYQGNESENDGKDKSDSSQDVGQVEYEMPLLAPSKDKRLLPVLQETPEREQDQAQVPQKEGEQGKYLHLSLRKGLDTWGQGAGLIEALASEFGVPHHALTNRRIDDQHVQFLVEPNPRSITARQMAKRIETDSDLKNRIDLDTGVEINRAASGHRDDIESVLFPTGANFNLLLLTVIAASTTAALLVVGIVSLLVKRRRRISRKQELLATASGLEGDMAAAGAKSSEEYKQLCRDWSRSSKKGQTTTAPTHQGKQKVQNQDSKESNRSSTSSWPEEPNTTNMDISTGHMVLAYMEDHLKNKQRLEQEWVSLCGYEAEPCATTIAFKAENKKKNRYPDKLPYDHNRVILNAVVNGSSSDYINASTVTDHDPRNPSYIVAQAPLANTVADFWQMIWEQGCVVIVMLSRLQDNGHQLCHRYWPEEGSEQYHIFEVHLVSEHVWCEDYLVRSVYLKNTRSGETRTVTQFHFRSWPSHGTPTSTKALLEFRRKVNKSYRGRSCPICVHCSDGVGRSGTYVLLDMVLNRMAKGCKEIDIAAALEHIRDQRGGMVQSRQQFEFCLMAVAEEVHAILKALPQ